MAAIFMVKQKVRERLKTFYECFRAEQVQIEGCTSKYAAVAFREGLLPNSHMYNDLVRKPAKDMSEIQTRIEGEISLEEIEAAHATRSTSLIASRAPDESNINGAEQNRSWNRNRRSEQTMDGRGLQENQNKFTISQSTILRAHQNEGIFTKPPPLMSDPSRRDQSRFCEFHREYSHTTNQCQNLRWQIESLMAKGKLIQYRALGEEENNPAP
uniref:uncharacterized protein LOC105350825 n=1 Tax=Fragaria vesca subsp. vesca TaxID=101020 RepID=UPI0005C96410|nr:PREDICTED: uncharacterized protein LOC105350825 [Fragaria vesca subsp. vesca]